MKPQVSTTRQLVQAGPLLQIENLSVSYASAEDSDPAVAELSLSVNAGEVLALVGESGSGKSTTARAVVGLLTNTAQIDSGQVTFEGQELLRMPRRRRRHIAGVRIGYIPQDPMAALNPVQRIGDQIAEVLRVHGLADRRTAAAAAVAALEAAGIDQPELRARQYPHQLSGGMRQRALIAAAMVAQPSLLVADEPTSALDVTVQRVILDRISELAADLGAGVLLITHDLGVAAERADRIAVMRHGRLEEIGATVDIVQRPQTEYTAELITAAPSLRRGHRLATSEKAPQSAGERAPLLQVRDVVKRFALPDGGGVVTAGDQVSFTIARGETFALVGESGSGKTTTARVAIRLERPDAGEVLFDGQDITNVRGERLRSLRRRFQYVPQSPYSSLDPRLTIGQQLTEPLRAFGIGDRAHRRNRILELLQTVELKPEHADRLPAALSGGQLQRVVIARALTLEPELLVLDEPVSALDVSVQARILDLLVRLQAELNLAYLFISHDLAVVAEIAHRVGVMRGGALLEVGPTGSVLGSPEHPYTRELINAIPKPLTERKEAR